MNYLNLPPLSAELSTAAKEFAKGLALSDNRAGFSSRYDETINAAVYEFTPVHSLARQANQEYEQYFGEWLIPVVGVMKNTADIPAQLPPHFDKLRKVAVNYVLEPGGAKVTTDFYNAHRDGDLSEGLHIGYEDIKPVASHTIKPETWHVIDVQQAHAVHGIETERVIFGFVLASNPAYDTFMAKFKDTLC